MDPGSVFQNKSPKKAPVHLLLRDQLVHIVEHLAAKEPEVSLTSCHRPKLEPKTEGALDIGSSGGVRDQIQMMNHNGL